MFNYPEKPQYIFETEHEVIFSSTSVLYNPQASEIGLVLEKQLGQWALNRDVGL